MCPANLRPACVAASLVMLVTGFSAISAQAGPAGAGDAPNSAPCELHVWPTDKFVVTENLGGANLGLAGRVAG
jgi:hypothetical protein